jgi:hypothetical protein
MEKQKAISRSLATVGIVTLALLSIPFVAMQFTSEVNWGPGDFIIMGALIFFTGTSYVLISRMSDSLVYRLGVGMAVITTFLLIWANLAVGLIGSGPSTGNLMYMGVIAVLMVAILLSRFTLRGMEVAMFATALSLVVHTGLALLLGMQDYPGTSLKEILGVNGFFTMLYLVPAFLFRYVRLAGSAGQAA